MKYKIIIAVPMIIAAFLSNAQEVVNLKDIQPPSNYENIKVEKLHTDSLTTSFIIWIKNGVKPHKHEYHSETIIVLEGEGIMTIGDNKFKIAKNDFFNIPINTVHSLLVNSQIPMKVISIQSPEFLGEDRVFVD